MLATNKSPDILMKHFPPSKKSLLDVDVMKANYNVNTIQVKRCTNKIPP